MAQETQQHDESEARGREASELHELLCCDNCGKEYDTAYEGVTSSEGRELCVNCAWDESILLPGEFIPE